IEALNAVAAELDTGGRAMPVVGVRRVAFPKDPVPRRLDGAQPAVGVVSVAVMQGIWGSGLVVDREDPAVDEIVLILDELGAQDGEVLQRRSDAAVDVVTVAGRDEAEGRLRNDRR